MAKHTHFTMMPRASPVHSDPITGRLMLILHMNKWLLGYLISTACTKKSFFWNNCDCFTLSHSKSSIQPTFPFVEGLTVKGLGKSLYSHKSILFFFFWNRMEKNVTGTSNYSILFNCTQPWWLRKFSARAQCPEIFHFRQECAGKCGGNYMCIYPPKLIIKLTDIKDG